MGRRDLRRIPPEAAVKRSETKPVTDLDHDGLPDVAELRTFNDRAIFDAGSKSPSEMETAYAAAYNLVRRLIQSEGEQKVWKSIADRRYS